MPPSAQLLDGKAIAQQVLAGTARKVEHLVRGAGRPPCLATVLVGADPASVTYTRMKRNRAESVGMISRKIELAHSGTTSDLLRTLDELVRDEAVDGILLQHPVPPGIDERAAFEAIGPEKDVDGVTLHSFGAMAMGLGGFQSCTPGGIMRLLAAYEIPLAGRHAVVVGRSPILGKPMAMLLLAAHCTVTICHSRTRDLARHVGDADLVIAAVGRARLIRGEWIKPGAVVVDAGFNEGNVGDADFEGCLPRASWITPVPGGVGPMTIATLIDQTADGMGRRTGICLDGIGAQP
ncbi:MAG: bifunctional 5,10-methylenetetrahydrofolate dehydrogenase/5,10-methenyltetrahydrofolate cyclohydrolase [Phycisphaeraceae bacterium]|nr:bifunctional 5,10-methylenetetrahydrofolate dehydrogenase/5,10-methenyltetrahydrofolate cyclohydrolase [Phycisphaeraceae bacterium]